jgi:hypothetical protein
VYPKFQVVAFMVTHLVGYVFQEHFMVHDSNVVPQEYETLISPS